MQIFVPSKSNSTASFLLKTLIQSFVLWLLTLGLIPYFILMLEQRFAISHFSFKDQRLVALIFFALFAIINLWCGIVMAIKGKGTPLPMDCARQLVIVGPYAYVRNPMAISGLGLGFSIGVWFGSYLVLSYVLAGMLFWNFVIRVMEERDLMARFGDEFCEYQRSVKCWRPRLSPYRHDRNVDKKRGKEVGKIG